MDLEGRDPDTLAEEVAAQAKLRQSEMMGLVNMATTDFQAHVKELALELYKPQKIEFSFMEIVDSLKPAFYALFPVEGVSAEVGKELIIGAADIFESTLKSAFREPPEATASERLQASAANLVMAADRALLDSWQKIHDEVKDKAKALLTGDYYVNLNDSDWAGRVCDDLGLPEPTRYSGHDAFRAQLEERFMGVYTKVQMELIGADDKEAEEMAGYSVDEATKLYHREGDKAWAEETKRQSIFRRHEEQGID